MQTTMKKTRSWLIAPALVLIAGCSSDTDYDFETSLANAEAAREAAALAGPTQALFDPADQVLPFPSNLLFSGSDDGTINIPNPSSNPQVALNQQDGFSTTSPIVTRLSNDLDPSSLTLGSTVRVFEVTQPAIPETGTEQEIGLAALAQPLSAQDIVSEVQTIFPSTIDKQLILSPLTPLKPSTSYLVVLTNGLEDTNGESLVPSITYKLLRDEQPLTNPSSAVLQSAVHSHIDLLLNEGLGIENREDVVLSWVFSTQSIRNVLQSVKDSTAASTLVANPAGIATDNFGGQGKADVYVGVLNLPYYLTVPASDNDPSLLAGFWKNSDGKAPGAVGAAGRNYAPVQTQTVTVPVLMTMPNANSVAGAVAPPAGWPVTIFQHGILQDRTNMLAVADSMADAGRAVVAIDLPLHGIVNTDSPLYAADNERTFNLDLVTVVPGSESRVPGPDQAIDSSGTHFFNLADLANARDNLRQAVADLFVLTASLSSGTDAAGASLMLDTSNLNYVGHSLGAIVGATMLSYETSFQTATLAMPGGGIAQLLRNSASFGPTINNTLAASGVSEGSADYQTFFIAAQTLLDSADPINHASNLAAAQTPLIHLIEVLGDQTIPNAVATAPLSGTEPLIRQLGLEAVTETVSGRSGVVRFNTGDHGSLIRPEPVPADSTDSPDLAPTIEMQTQMATFAASPGATILITNADLIAPAPAGAQ